MFLFVLVSRVMDSTLDGTSDTSGFSVGFTSGVVGVVVDGVVGVGVTAATVFNLVNTKFWV